MNKQVIFNIEEMNIRIAFLEDGELSELYIEKTDDQSIVGNIYVGIVEDVVPGLKAAFIDIGFEKRAFLHFDDFTSDALLLSPAEEQELFKPFINTSHQEADKNSRRKSSRKKPRIDPHKILKRGMKIIVQVVKDEIGKKSARVTSFVTLPGRFLVLLPFPEMEGGVSKKISNKEERQRLKKILNSFKTRKANFIIRTAGNERDEKDLSRDVNYLKIEWSRILRTFRKLKSPGLIYNDHDIFYRLIRDIFTDDINEIVVDSSDAFQDIKRILKIMIPELKDTPKMFDAHKNVFEVYDVDRQIQKASKSRVWLKSGGFLVFDEMEALTAIDVNTGRYVGGDDQEKTILKTNLEAAKMVAQQIRLRDIGGLIVVDFIDMLDRENKETLEREFRKFLKNDKTKMSLTKLSEFGLIEMTRRRAHESLRNILFTPCPYCGGSGKILNPLEIWRKIKYAVLEKLHDEENVSHVVIMAHPNTQSFIMDSFAGIIQKIEKKNKTKIEFIPNEEIHVENYQINTFKKQKNEKDIKLVTKK